MKKSLISMLFVLSSLPAVANDQTECQTAAGTLVIGTALSDPDFAAGTSTANDDQSSQTRIKMRGEQDGQTYDVEIDNIFAFGYVLHSKQVPDSLAAIHVGDRISVCGMLDKKYMRITHVHNNCNAAPAASAPNGWIKKAPKRGPTYANLERNQFYCALWKK